MTTHNRLKVPPHLNGRHQHTYEAVFRHPAAHNLEWHDVRSLLAAMGDVVEEENGSVKVTRNGHVLILHVPRHKDLATVEDLLAIRRFLEQSTNSPTPLKAAPGD